MAIRKPGAYAPLSAHYADDERIMEAGEDAELLFCRMLAYAARTPLTEGWISEVVMMTRLGFTDPTDRIERLMKVCLIERDDSGYQIVSWLRWNKSAEEMGRERSRDRRRKARDLHVSGNSAGNEPGTDAGTRAGLPHTFPLSNTEANTQTETEAQQRTDSLALTGSPNSQTLVAEWLDHCPGPVPGQVKGQIAKLIKQMLDDGIDYETVRIGLADWNTRDLHPSTLPSIVHGVNNRKPRNGRQAHTDDIFGRAMERAIAKDAMT